MQWFRHNNNFRNRPEMRYITNALGAHGSSAAYRLLEVLCDLCGSGEKFNPTLVLGSPYTPGWLANEILLPDETDDTEADELGNAYADRSVERLKRFLSVFEGASLIAVGEIHQQGRVQQDDGKWVVKDDVAFMTITLLCADGLLDAWTSRYKRKGAGQGTRTDLK